MDAVPEERHEKPRKPGRYVEKIIRKKLLQSKKRARFSKIS